MSELQTFTFEESFAVSAVIKDGIPWFIAGDVCDALGIHRTAIRRLDDDERDVRTVHTLGGTQEVSIINESGLYSLIFTSRKESAKRFKKWVTSVVLPNIRKHGGYMNGMEALEEASRAETIQTIQQEVKRIGMCHAEEKEARSEAFRLLRRR